VVLSGSGGQFLKWHKVLALASFSCILKGSKGFHPMSITLTTNYKEILNADTVEFIEERLEDSCDLDEMLKFIDEHNEDNFVEYYEEYFRCCEAIGSDAVNAYIEEEGCISCVDSCDEKYVGCYDSEADFAEDYHNERHDIPSDLVIDWEATWETNLRYDYTSCDDGTSYRPTHIFRKY